ncbi:MAG: phosphatidylglycerol lysyltransferase domain-containing protein [Sporomusaceae bacterium]|nr:phosphatidylglycerol lysyltransferase domain-containing protein [Sporomusaceae bacterium]
MIPFQPITLADKPLFDSFFRAKRYEQSSCTFTNLYMWRCCYNIVWAVVDDCLCLQVTYGGATYSLPPFGPDQERFRSALAKLEQHYQESGLPFVMKSATTDMVEWCEAAKPGYFVFESDRDNYDYVYSTRDLIELQGRKFHIKKNHLNRFRKMYSQYEYKPIDTALTEACIEYELEWYGKREGEPDPSLLCERDAIIDVMRHWDTLGVSGGVILINGRIEAFTFGEMLNDDTAVIHVEKGNADIRGIYQAINQEFCEKTWSQVPFVNREEDMGIAGIRRAKESYMPVRMIEKYNITVKA